MARKKTAKKKASKKKTSKKKASKIKALGVSNSDEFRWLCEDCSEDGSWTTEAKAEAGANKHMADYEGHVATVEQR
jgi:hypothetical protein